MSYSQERQLQSLLNIIESGRRLSKKQKCTLDRIKRSMSDEQLEIYNLY